MLEKIFNVIIPQTSDSKCKLVLRAAAAWATLPIWLPVVLYVGIQVDSIFGTNIYGDPRDI